MKRSRFEGCRAVGLELAEAVLEDVYFANCTLDLASFRMAEIMRLAIVTSSARELDFTEAALRHGILFNTDLTGTTFGLARCSNLALHGSTLDDCIGLSQQHGLIIDSRQLMVIAQAVAAEHGIVTDDHALTDIALDE